VLLTDRGVDQWPHALREAGNAPAKTALIAGRFRVSLGLLLFRANGPSPAQPADAVMCETDCNRAKSALISPAAWSSSGRW
jgi:hypothetical protein